LTRKLKLSLFSLFVVGWLFFIAPDQSFADEVTVQVSPAPSETSTATIQATAQIAVETAQAAVTEAQTTIQSVDTQSNSLTNPTPVNQAIAQAQTAIDNVNQNIQTVMTAMTDLGTANNNVSLQQVIVESTTASVSQAETAVTQATQEVSTATAQVATDTQALQTANQNLEQAQTNLTNAQTTLTQASAAVDAQEPVVATAQTNKDAAQAVVNSNTSPGLTVTVYSNPGTNQSPAMGGNIVYTGTDTNGINEQWGGGGPTVNGGTTTVTETFTNGTSTYVSIAPVGGVSIGGNWADSAGKTDVVSGSALTIINPSSDVVIDVNPSNTGTVTQVTMGVYAKNGDTNIITTNTNGTTTTTVMENNVSATNQASGYTSTETVTGTNIDTVTLVKDSDYYVVDNITITKTTQTTVTEDFQVRWQGLWTPQYTGTQYITAPADDGVRLYLDGELIIDDWVDKGGGGSTADVPTTAGVAKTFDMWYYENGGGANVSLLRYTGSGWEIIPASEFSTSTASATQLATLATATQTLNTEQATLTTLQQAETTAQNNVTSANQTVSNQTLVVQTAQNDLQISNQVLQTSQQNLTTANENLTTANQNLTTANQNLTNLQSTAQAAEVSASMAISNLNTSVQTMQTAVTNAQSAQTVQSNFEQQQRAAAAAAAAVYVPPTPEPPTPVEPTPPTDTPEDPTEPEPETPVDPAPEEPSDNPSTDTPTDTTDTTDTTDSTDQTNSDTTNTDSSNEDASSSDNTDTPSQPSDPADTPTDNTPSEPQPTVDPTPEPSPQEHSTPESTPGLVENNPNSLPETTPKLPDPSALVPRVQVDKPGVENGGIEFFGTKSQPQVIGEDGKLTPPPPPPGSGLPIPPDAITTVDTFIGQPGGTSFNAPDIAVPVIMSYVCTTVQKDGKDIHIDTNGNEHPIEQCTFLPAALEAIPGAGEAIQAMGAAYAAIANIGNDMSPVTRKKAKKVLVVTAAIVAFRRRFGND